MMAGSSRYSQRQTRLAFTPLPSSSPAAKEYNKQIRDRAAAVSLDASPRPIKRRRVRDNDLDSGIGGAQLDGVNDSIPTPTASLKRGGEDAQDSSDSEPIRSTQRRSSTQDKLTSTRKSRQQQLDFAGARDADSFDTPMRFSSSARPQSSARAGIFSTQPQQKRIVDISSDESDDELPSPAKLMEKSKGKRARKSNDTGKINASSSRVTRSTHQPIAVDSESEDDNIKVNSGQPNAIEEESENEDDEMPTTTGTQRRKRAKQASPDSFISSSPPRALDSNSDLEIIEQPKKQGRRLRSDEGNEEEEIGEDDGPVTPSRRRPKRQKWQISRRDEEDLAADLDFLEPSSDVEDSMRKPRNTQTAQKDARQKALDRLKRRRSTQVAHPENEDNEEGEEQDDEVQEESDELYDDVDEQLQPTSSRHMFNEDENDQDFIEEDDDQPLGVPEGIPIHLTRFASMKAKELFKYAVEWMVQKKINPAFRMNDEIYDLTFQKLDNEVKGLAGSKFISSVWTPDFSMALRSRPNIAYSPIDRTSAEHFMRDTCDACNRTGHPATYQIQFQDKPYHPQTLEEVAGNGDDDEEDSDSTSDSPDVDDEPGWDAQGRQIPPANRTWYVGKFCMSNARTAHALGHWRWHMNEWVVDWLDNQAYLSADKIVERDRWSVKKKRKHANRIVDRMEAEGAVKELWTSFRESVDEARDSKQGRYGAWS